MVRKKLKLGIIGCGRVCEHYIEKILIPERVGELYEVVACCDVDEKKSNYVAERYSCEAFSNINEFIKCEGMEFVLVLTKSGQHYEHAKVCLSNHLNVIVEKPLSLRVEHAEELIQISSETGKFCASIFQNRLNPAVEITKKAFESNRFGKLVSVSVRLRWCRLQEYYDDGWHGTWAQDGGVTNQQAIHHVDALTWICGEVKSVSAMSAKRANQLQAEDTLVAAIDLENGGLATLELTTAARPKDIEASITITGTKGVAQIGGVALNKIEQWNFTDGLDDEKKIKHNFSEEVDNGYGISHYRQLKKIFETYQIDKSCKVPFLAIECLHTLKLIHSIYASIELDRKVALSENLASSKLGL
ncbi:Gfo/Idh/MocA family oxidoreductase [Paracoccaceae bacterium]|nr:Gfo/Idh/MocA family oxidoreductase [Paracoccaceae bacterium]